MLSNIGELDTIITETVTAIENGKRQVFDIAENTRIEHQRLKMELEEVRIQVTQLVGEVDSLTIDEKKSRQRLAEVSKNFKKYSEESIKKAYEEAQEKQIRLATLRGRESLLRYKRNNLEQSLRRLDNMLNKAENLASQLAVVTGFLTGNLKDFYQKIGEMQQVQQLGISIIKAQEEERHRVARDIHDGPAQLLANIVMRAEFCLKLMDIDRTKVKEELHALQHMVRQSLQDVRKIIFDLRPMVLDDLGLVPAIKRYIEDYQGQYGLAVELVVIGTPRRFSIAIEVAVFRIMQECLNNIRKHAQATMVAIKVEFLDNKINAVVKDNGVGFNPDSMIKTGKKECFGILGMRERAQILNGEINLISAPGQGTTISVSVPLEGEG
ncbi:MAG: histidine kinase [Peptococcaceae bacterium BICA1-7]|nr:MAG: histidine kinase [Peptococcaceae bacterium BICA1-7]HBV98149.1 histidine kinase [Desulfotomaculum sp.]